MADDQDFRGLASDMDVKVHAECPKSGVQI